MSYQKKTGPIMANSHPGSYCGQDAYNDMLITESKDVLRISENRRIQTVETGENISTQGLQECDRFDTRGGEGMKTIVRRLTPLECERLQGFPDNWTDIGEWVDSKGKKHKEADSPRYKALGNSIALPFWFYLLRRISAQYERPATMGSLFSGIGGFDLCWIRCNGTQSVLWSSEVEPFCIAVMKQHFGDEESKGDVGEYL